MTATSSKDQEFYQTYLEKLNDEDTDGEEIGNKLIQSIKHDFDTEVEDTDDEDNGGTIIVDADGNYYFQKSEEVKVEKLLLNPEKTTDATATTSNGRSTVQSTPVSGKKTQLAPSTSKAVKNNDVIPKTINKSINSEISNQDEVYEFDESELDLDDCRDVDDPDYQSKGVIKKIKISTSNESASFTCVICPYQTTKKFLLSRHMKTHSDERPYKCSVCERGFKTKASLMNHRNTHLGLKPHACKDCDMAFTTSGELVRHVRYRHTHIKPHKCTECDYSSVEMSKLRRHIRCHTGERPYQCPHCTYASPDTFKLKRHMRTHTGEKPYECDICHARFTQSNSLKHHRLIHSVNEKPVFQCHLCPTTCGRKTDLRLHIKKLHSSDQPIPCKRCGKEWPDRYTYKLHIKTHEGEKCYRCDYCPYASISKRHLEAHVFIHLDTKPFVCEICRNSFRQKPLLTRHMKIYHSDNYEPPMPREKDHKCPHCTKKFAFKGNLMRHMEVHDPTSRLFEMQQKLKEGRMKRVQPDGTVIIETPSNKLSKFFDGNNEYFFEDTEEQQQQQLPVENELLQEEEYDEEIDYNGDNMQYVYDELEEDEYEEQDNTVGVEYEEQEEEETTERKNIIDVKVEKIDTIVSAQPSVKKSINVKPESNNDFQTMSMEVQDDQGFLIIEVLPDEEEEQEPEPEVQQKQGEVRQLLPSQDNANKIKVIKTHKNTQPLISDYFGFEVDEDEEDEETKGAIKLLEMIEQE